MGDSIPHWAGVRARETGKPNLRTTREIGWHAVRGLKWHGLRRAIETEVLLGNTPNVIIIHLGGNDLASESVFRLKNIISKEVCYFRTAFPAAILVWVDIIQRRTWVGASDAKAIEKKRVGKYLGWKPQYKKAIVTLSEGDVINLFTDDN